MLILFDRSGSMNAAFGTGTRFEAEANVLRDLLPIYEDKIRFGFLQFPASNGDGCSGLDGCCAEAVKVPVGLRTAAAISRAVEAASPPDGNTPTASALAEARRYFESLDDGIAERYVLLSTDGRPTCGRDGRLASSSQTACAQAIEEVDWLATIGVRVLVLALGPGLAFDPDGSPSCLAELARRGAEPGPSGAAALFTAADTRRLEEAFTSIFAGVVRPSCTIELSATPSDANQVRVFIDGRQVPRDANDGWEYFFPGDPRRIQLHGSVCRRVTTFQAARIEVRFGCPPCTEARNCD